ncbi:hypothetical protein J2Y54_001244 [Sphingomonas sp. BE123]|uniref:hypothetical protein n=1 Tax=Sphingomonas sp. BE123 TaxID=2817842 RepID=UPI0028649378|nr:hypothetical protein [Sphingomonas sp. BE123]MDR6851751.1 hypothetical protein [Sphingomonas sp. BE123]
MGGWTVESLNAFGRTRLSQHFYMRDFLFSDIASIHGLINAPDDRELAITAGSQLCEQLLEPLQRVFGRVAIRSAYRSCAVNALGNAMQKAGRSGYNCAENEKNYAAHIWDRRDADGHMGAMACVVLPEFVDAFPGDGDWTHLAWWVHDHLPYATLEFFPTNWAFNISWHEQPQRTIYSYAKWREGDGWKARGYLTRAGMDKHAIGHRAEWDKLIGRFPLADEGYQIGGR